MKPFSKFALKALSAIVPVLYADYKNKPKKYKLLSDRLYHGHINGEFTTEKVIELCKEYGIEYPPRPMQG